MTTGRRLFLSSVAALLASGRELLAASKNPQQFPGSPQLPDASVGPGQTPREMPLPPRADPKVALREDQKNLRKNVDRLLQMVKDLKEETDKTQETDVLSLSLVKKAEDIEKLARQIKELIRSA